MDLFSILTALIPLAALSVIDYYKSKRAAIICAIGMALYELIFSIAKTGGIDILTVTALLMSILFIVITVKMNSELYFKVQQGILIFFAAVLLIFFSVVLNKPLLFYMMDKYYPEMLTNFNPLFKNMLDAYSLKLGVGLLFYSILSAYAGFKWSKWIKFIVNVPLLFVFMIALMVV